MELRFGPDYRQPATTPLSFDFKALLEAIGDPEAYGRLLTDQLLADQAVRRACEDVFAMREHAFSVRLRLGEDVAPLHLLRWETLCNPRNYAPLALNERTPFARTIDGGSWSRARPRAWPEQPRALVVVSAPQDLDSYRLAAIDADAEVRRIATALAPIPVEVLGNVAHAQGRATLTALQTALQKAPHIFILVAHGALSDSEPVLYLEHDDGTTDSTLGAHLFDAIANLYQPPLLCILASCRSAGDDESALTALGPRIAQAGVPAVLAFQGDVAMASVELLLPKFLAQIQHDGCIDRALAAARVALGRAGPWWQPVLFLRGDGCLRAKQESDAGPGPSVPALPDQPLTSVDPTPPMIFAATGNPMVPLSVADRAGLLQLLQAVFCSKRYDDPEQRDALFEQAGLLEDLRSRMRGRRVEPEAVLLPALLDQIWSIRKPDYDPLERLLSYLLQDRTTLAMLNADQRDLAARLVGVRRHRLGAERARAALAWIGEAKGQAFGAGVILAPGTLLLTAPQAVHTMALDQLQVRVGYIDDDHKQSAERLMVDSSLGAGALGARIDPARGYVLLRLAAASRQPERVLGDLLRRGLGRDRLSPELPAPGAEIYLWHHPAGRAAQLTLGTTLGRSGEGVAATELRYTLSNADEVDIPGSPIFDRHWRLVGLHQRTDSSTGFGSGLAALGSDLQATMGEKA